MKYDFVNIIIYNVKLLIVYKKDRVVFILFIYNIFLKSNRIK